MTKNARILLGVTLAFVLVLGAGVTLLADTFLDVPDFGEMKNKVEVPIKLADGTKTTKWVGPKAPGWVGIAGISNYLLAAVISSEDTAFYSHKGVDYHELKEAIKKDLKEKRWARGASTLTQQVIKNVYLSPRKTVWRKFKEIIWAGKLEEALTKSQILCFYVNMAEWGPGIYGIGAASNYYFHVPPSQLTPKQSAFLAMLLPSPIRYHAYYRKKELTKWANRRINQILLVMNSMGHLDENEYASARGESLFGETPENLDPNAVPSGGEDTEVPAISESDSFENLSAPASPPPPAPAPEAAPVEEAAPSEEP